MSKWWVNESVIMAEQTVSNEINALEVQAFELPLFQAMRRLQQDAEVHAKRLARYGSLSPVQLMILQVLAGGEGQMTASALSRRVSLTAATLSVSSIDSRNAGCCNVSATTRTAAANGCCSATVAGNCCRTHRRCCRRSPHTFRRAAAVGAPRADGGLAACRRALWRHG